MRLSSFSQLLPVNLGWICSWNTCHNRLFQYFVCGHCHTVPLIHQGAVWQCNSHTLIEKMERSGEKCGRKLEILKLCVSHSSLTPSSLHLALAASLECCPFAPHSDSQRSLPFTRRQAFHHLSLSGKSAHFLAIMEVSGNTVSLFFQFEDWK